MQALHIERHARMGGLGLHTSLDGVDPLCVAPLCMPVGDRDPSGAPQPVVRVEVLGPGQAVDRLASGTTEVGPAGPVHRETAVQAGALARRQ